MKNLMRRAKQSFYKMSARLSRTVAILGMAVLSQPAWALKLSGLTDGMSTEVSSVVKLVLLVIAGVGVCVAGTAVITWIFAKKNNEPAKWQLSGVIGGAAAVVIPLIVLAVAGSLTGEQGNADGVFNELGIQG